LSKKILSLLIGSALFFAACRKDELAPITGKPVEEACVAQIANPGGASYAADSVVAFDCTQKHCGILPLSTKNFWIYQDSVFTDGVFLKVQMDTLHYAKTWRSLEDSLVWWQSNISVGLPSELYANDSSFFAITDRQFTPGIKDVKKDFTLFTGDSLHYLTNFDDAAAQGRSLKLTTDVVSPAGSFSDCIYFEKNARNYRMDQVYFKPELGVIRYVLQQAPPGQRVIKLQHIYSLVAFHLE